MIYKEYVLPISDGLKNYKVAGNCKWVIPTIFSAHKVEATIQNYQTEGLKETEAQTLYHIFCNCKTHCHRML